jgi:DNA invertase Pin-like site-specific DNA recombinase
MKVALYIRISRRDLNPENQKLQLINHCKKNNWEYKIFQEQESTRKTRPIKQEVLKQLREGKFDGVLIWKLDRWARSLQELIMDIDNITARNKAFIVLTQPIDTTSASGRLFMQILGAFAEFEREIIRERTIAGLERAKAQGKKLGRPKKTKVIKRGGFKYKLQE